jgi:antitoxin HigA-1
MTKLKPIHPGEILREEFMIPFGLSPTSLLSPCGRSSEHL